jgi:hypothetical protein
MQTYATITMARWKMKERKEKYRREDYSSDAYNKFEEDVLKF